MTAAEWNARYPEGTRVRWLGAVRKTVGPAWDSEGRSIVELAPGFNGEKTSTIFTEVLEIVNEKDI